MVKGLAVLITLVLLGIFPFGGTRVMAEEILITENGIHLGWVTSKNTFTTCRKTIIQIADGSVEKTKNSCPSFERTPLVKGLVDSIDGPNQILLVREEGGQIQTLFFFENTEGDGKTHLKDLEKGDKVIVTVPIPGRGGSIQIESRQGSERLPGTSTATVVGMDYANRTGTLKFPDGTTVTFKASPEARNFDQLKVGDQVLIRN